MGKGLKKEAMQLGLTKLPKYTFYGRPKKIKMKFYKPDTLIITRYPFWKPDTAYVIENWMTSIDPSCAMKKSPGARSFNFFYMSTQLGVYVEVYNKIAGVSPFNPDNYVSQIDIYTNNEDHVRAIAKGFNSLWDDGILPHIDFKKIEKKFKVGKEDVIKQWNAFL